MNTSSIGSEVHLPPDTPRSGSRTDEDARRGRHELQRHTIRAEGGAVYGPGSRGRQADRGLGLARQPWVAGLVLLLASVVAGCDGGTRADQPNELAREWRSPAGMVFVWIPAGSFVMGSPEDEAGRDGDEIQHEVRISQGFWMGKYEVTQGEWVAVMGTNPSNFDECGSQCPVESVSWKDAQEFIGELNRRESRMGNEYRLPTEAEWEHAARAGTTGATPEGDLQIMGESNAPRLDGQAWYAGNSGVTYADAFNCWGWEQRQYESERCGPHPVGQKRANGWGLHDMLGNVWEWTADRYGEYPPDTVTDPRGLGTGSYRVYRGGGWSGNAGAVRSADRSRSSTGYRHGGIGFRLVRTE